MRATAKGIRLGNCPSCGVELTEGEFDAGSTEGPPEARWATRERWLEGDRMELRPCGCTFVGEDARRELMRLRDLARTVSDD
jgi:hypothetical protein